MKIIIGKRYYENLRRVKSLVELARGNSDAEVHILRDSEKEIRIVSCAGGRCYECGGKIKGKGFLLEIYDKNKECKESYFFHVRNAH